MSSARALQVALALLVALYLAAGAKAAARPVKALPACSTKGGATYTVYDEAGFLQRLRKPNTTVVTLRIGQNIPLSQTLVLNASFSCTILIAAKPNVTTIYNLNDMIPTIMVKGAAHMLFSGVNVAIQTYDTTPELCPYAANLPNYQGNVVCPALLIFNSKFIKVTQAQVYGRVDFVGTNNSLFDAMTIQSNHGVHSLLRFANVGEGKYLIRSNNTISNCIFNGGPQGYSVGVLLYRNSVGVNIVNNDFYNFTFAAIECGGDVHNVGDCMLMKIANNYIQNGGNAMGDGTGIYFDTHWYNPGNLLQCNYVVGGSHCLYLDFLSSGIRIDGMVCYNTTDGVKLNGGKWNMITGMVIVNLHVPRGAQANPGFINCENVANNNCVRDPGSSWVNQWYNKYYKAAPALWKKNYPKLMGICQETHVNGYACNPPGGVPANVTGNCSALGTGNTLNFAVVHNTSQIIYPFNDKCDPFRSFLPHMNVIKTVTLSPAAAAFNGYNAGDFGIASRRSELLRLYPGFRSCPRSQVGPRPLVRGTAPYLPL